MKVTDEAVWKRVESGELTGFSVMGLARREPVEDIEEDLVMEKKGLGGLAEEFIEKIKRGLLGAGGEGHVAETAPPAVVEKEEVLDTLARDETGEADSENDAEAAEISTSEPEADDRSAGEEVMSTIKGFTGHVEPLVKHLPDAVEKGPSTFRTELGKELLWNGTSALRSAIFEAIDSDAIDTMEGVQAAIDDFAKWLLNLLGFTSTDEVVAAAEPADGAEPTASAEDVAGDEPVEKSELEPESKGLGIPGREVVEAAIAAAMQEATAPLLERIGVLEKATPGRQTLLGEDKEIKKEKGFKGLPLRS